MTIRTQPMVPRHTIPLNGKIRPLGGAIRMRSLLWTWFTTHVPLALLVAVTTALTLKFSTECKAQSAGEAGKPITKIRAGTVIQEGEPPPNWTETLLIADPRITDGDVDAVSRTIKRYAELWKFVIVARTEPVNEPSSTPQNETPRYQLDDVGVGLAMARGTNLIVASGQSGPAKPVPNSKPAADSKPPRLGLIEQQLLRAAEESLDQMRVVARRTTLVLFDSPGVVHHDGKNRELVVRTLVWVSPSSGKTASAFWLLRKSDDGTPETVGDHGVAIPARFREERRLHVDADELVIGIPTPRAFALAQLPPGRRFAIDDELAIAASRERYSDSQIEKLASLLNAAIRGGTR